VKRLKDNSLISQMIRHNGFLRNAANTVRKLFGPNGKYRWLVILVFPIAGLVSLLWFLIRVVPKPSRATYPCQRVAVPLAGSFLAWVVGLIGSTLAYRKARRFFHQSRYVLTAVCAGVAVLAIWWSLSVADSNPASAAFVPAEPPNSPMGVAKGIYPGRVVWVRDLDATSWDASTGRWWDDASTNQEVVDYMVSEAIQTLSGQPNDKQAWDALFRHFNQTRGLGDTGYQDGEKVVIKINMNQDSGSSWGPAAGMPSPHVIYSFLTQLIKVVGVPGSAITIYDAARYIGDPIYDKVRSNPDPNFQSITFVTSSTRNGRIGATRDTGNPVYTQAGTAYLPQSVTGAKYLINMALLRPHTLYGITLSAKNHFGSVYFTANGWTPSPLHNYGGRSRAMNTYNCLVELNGHRHLSGKTLLYFIDALYPAVHQSGNVIKYASFGDDWFSSVLASQDPVAIDSVGLDFMRNEPRCTEVTGYPENYLHEMALADNPPSGTFYDPERDGIRLTSLGVHEHWNNPVDRQYSRNLGTGNGIELVTPSFVTPDGPVENVTAGKRYDCIRHAVTEAAPGDEIIASPGVYHESLNFGGKNLIVRSVNPDDPEVVAATRINGSVRAVIFSSGEDASCVLAGFTITDANTAIYCSGTSPTITNCRIVANEGAGIKLHESCNPTITNCIIADNGGSGIEMEAPRVGRFVKYNYATITGCIISGNQQCGIWGDMPTVTNATIVGNRQQGVSAFKPIVANSIIYYNGPDCGFAQIDGASSTISYSNVQGSWPGTGNVDVNPRFVVPGYWADPTKPTIPVEPSDPASIWISGDCHLRWDSACINAGDPDFVVTVAATDVDGEPRIISGRVDMGCDEVGEKQADFSRDGIINTEDLAMFVQAWLTTPDQQAWDVLCDLYEDELVDLTDWAELAKNWLWQAEWYE
jgi:parallel beta-helix repeat protein